MWTLHRRASALVYDHVPRLRRDYGRTITDQHPCQVATTLQLDLTRVTPSPQRRTRFVHRIGGPSWFVLTGVLLGLSFPPISAYPLALVALVPMLARWSLKPSPGALFRESYAAFLIFAAMAGFWVFFHPDTLKALMMGVGILTLPAIMALPVVGSSLVARRLGLVVGLLAFAAAWLAMELILVHGPAPVPWLLLGHTQADALSLNQFADIFGVGGLTLWVIAVNAVVFATIHARMLTPRFAGALGLILLMAAPMGYKAWRMTQLPPTLEPIRVAVVQPVLSAERWSEIASVDRVQILADLADERLKLTDEDPVHRSARPRVVIWPETSLPVFPDGRLQQTLYNRVAQWSSRRNVSLVTGAVTRFDTAPALTVEPFLARQSAGTTPYYNSVLLFDGQPMPQQYDKIQMVPVADQVPMVGWEPGQRLGVGHSFGIGGRRTLFRTAGARFSTLVSYELFFGHHARGMVSDGAEFLTALSNNSAWGFAHSFNQFESIARLRAIENRRAVVLASVNGGSGMILPDGSTASSAPWMEQSVVVLDVPRSAALSTYAASGDVVYNAGGILTIILALIYGGALLFFPVRRQERRRPRQPVEVISM